MVMGDVVDIKRAAPERWVEGPMLCTACKHEWHGTCPVGCTSGFTCPECGSGRAILKYPVIPAEIWRCDCGGDLFHLTRDGAVCRECGDAAHGWQ